MLPLASTLPEYTVTELSLALKKIVETGFSRVRVKGEISGLKRHTSGHVYFCFERS
jgi:exodeoxyribonuclease VII large subunit